MSCVPESTASKISFTAVNAKVVLWALLAALTVWVVISNQVAFLVDYPLFRDYVPIMVKDRALLIPHALLGCYALLAGPAQFSSRLRRRPGLHRLVGRGYVIAVYGAGLTSFALAWPSFILPGTLVQAGTWMFVTTIAWVLARNGHTAAHRQWMARSYAVTFTFVSLRILSVWPAYWYFPNKAFLFTGVTLGSVLVADVIMNWRELRTRRA